MPVSGAGSQQRACGAGSLDPSGAWERHLERDAPSPRAGGGEGPAPAPWVSGVARPTLTPVVLWASDHVPVFPQLAGGVILGVALWLRHDPQTTNLLYLELGDRPAPNTFYVGECTWLALGLGARGSDLSRCLITTATARRSGRTSRRKQGTGQASNARWAAGRPRPARKGSLGERARV